MTSKILKLKVVEAIQDDLYKGIVRLDTSFMHQIDVRPGDIVEIEGDRKTLGIVERAYPGDIGLNIIRMDGLMRRNSKTGIGEIVKVKKGTVKEAKNITIAPAKKGIIVKANPIIFKQGLLGRPVLKGDLISLGGSKRRRAIMSENPLFEDVFKMLDESMMSFGLGDLKFIVVDTNPKEGVMITDNTNIEFNPEAVELKVDKAMEVTYEDIGGLEEEVKKVREMLELPLKRPEIFERLGIEPPKGVLLHGPPGTGKTLLAKAVANETQSNFLVINGPEIMSKYYGQSEENLRKKFEDAEKNAPSIIFIDEIDAIASKREEAKGEVERRVVAQLLALMDGLKSRGKVIVMAATNIPNQLDTALRRPGRFDREIEIGVPSKEGRLNILKIHTRNMPLEKNVSFKKISEVTHGFVGADLSALAKEAAMNLLRRILPELKLKEEEPIPKETLEKLFITQQDFVDALKNVRPSALREVLIELPNVKWENIGGLSYVKQELKEAVEWPLKYPQAFKRLGIKPPKGVLIYGPPGTGKTMLAKAVANETEANFILVKGPELLSKWVGESERGVRKIFEKARQASPSIIFFDEIDALAPRRGESSDVHVTERVVNQLLTEIDGLEEMHNIVIIGATNRPDIVDTALLRPGRFDRIILAGVPDFNARKEIFAVHTKSMPIDFKTVPEDYNMPIDSKTSDKDYNVIEIEKNKDINKTVSEKKQEKIETKKTEVDDSDKTAIRNKFLYYLAEKTKGYVGADIESVCREAAILSLRKDINSKILTIKNFEEALKKVRPSVSKDIEDMYKSFKEQFSAAKAKEMLEEKPSYYG